MYQPCRITILTLHKIKKAYTNPAVLFPVLVMTLDHIFDKLLHILRLLTYTASLRTPPAPVHAVAALWLGSRGVPVVSPSVRRPPIAEGGRVKGAAEILMQKQMECLIKDLCWIMI